MATAPNVQSLNQLMAELAPGYAGQKNVINQQIANTDKNYNATGLALDAEKTRAFNQINSQAAGRGASFSGIPIGEQADYLSTKYLPGKQEAAAKRQADILTLQGQMATLDTDARNKAFDSRSKQISELNEWNLNQANIAAAAEAARLQREFDAAENAKNRSASAGGGSSYSAVPLYDQLALRFEQMANEYGDVTPNQWKILRSKAKENGMTDKEFADTFWNYADDKIWQQYLS